MTFVTFVTECPDTEPSAMDIDGDMPPSPSTINEDDTSSGSIPASVSPIYQTRWTFACKHMFIHDDEDPLYPIRYGPPQLLKTFGELCPMCKDIERTLPPRTKELVLRDDEKHLTALTAQKQEFSQQMRDLVKAGQGREARAVQDFSIKSMVAEARQAWEIEKFNVNDTARGLYAALRLDPRNIASALVTKQRFVQEKLQKIGLFIFIIGRHADSADERAKFKARRAFIYDLETEIRGLADGYVKGLNKTIPGGMNEIVRREVKFTDVWDRYVEFIQGQSGIDGK